jgi:hypothetical protein
VFRIDLSRFGMGTLRIAFSRGPDGRVTALHFGQGALSLHKRPPGRTPTPRATRALAMGAVAVTFRRVVNDNASHRLTFQCASRTSIS